MKLRACFTTITTIALMAFLLTGISTAEDFTLSDNALMTMLNQTNKHVWSKASIVEKRDIPKPGVEFDIYFPGKEHSFECFAPKMEEPNNPLFSSDLRVFDAFALKFSLLAVDGDASPSHTGRLVVGAYLNAGYRPECVTLDPSDSNTTVSRTRVGPDDVYSIGITMHMLTSAGWDPNGTTITLLVEPAPEAVALPKTPESTPRNITGKIIYVDTSATGSNNGSNWVAAYQSLQDSLAAAAKGDEIWVARGTYKPNQGNQPDKGERAATFTLKNGVAI